MCVGVYKKTHGLQLFGSGQLSIVIIIPVIIIIITRYKCDNNNNGGVSSQYRVGCGFTYDHPSDCP